MARAGQEIAERQTTLGLGDVRFIEHLRLAAAVALNAPRGKGAQRLGQGLPWQGFGAVGGARAPWFICRCASTVLYEVPLSAGSLVMPIPVSVHA